MSWEKYVCHWEKWNFEPIGNLTHTTEFLALLHFRTSLFIGEVIRLESSLL